MQVVGGIILPSDKNIRLHKIRFLEDQVNRFEVNEHALSLGSVSED